MSKLLNLLLGFCAHDRCTFPMSLKSGRHRPEAAKVTGVYVVCLACGREFAYSWDQMRVVSGEKTRRTMTVESISTEMPLAS
jgi:hypothetical protein